MLLISGPARSESGEIIEAWVIAFLGPPVGPRRTSTTR